MPKMILKATTLILAFIAVGASAQPIQSLTPECQSGLQI
jgi:hypothetical protein